MKLDRTLIDKDGAPSEEETRDYFLKHDYTAYKSSFDPMTASDAELRLYQKAKEFFKHSSVVFLNKKTKDRAIP